MIIISIEWRGVRRRKPAAPRTAPADPLIHQLQRAPSNSRVGKICLSVSDIAVLARHYNKLERLDGKHKMSRSYYRWVIVAAGGLLGCVAIGAMFSLPVFLRPIARDTGWSITGVSSAMTFGFLAMALGSVIWGNLSDRFGPRLIVLIGSSVLAIALALASRATSLIEFQLIFGLVVGGATAAIFAPMMACVTGWSTHIAA
jgi:predicted MFS family arabinose efflux permease